MGKGQIPSREIPDVDQARRARESREMQRISVRPVRIANFVFLSLMICFSLREKGLSAGETPPIPAKLQRYAQWMVRRHDSDGDNRLTAAELGQNPEIFRRMDRDGNESVTVGEIAADAWAYALQRMNLGVVEGNRTDATSETAGENEAAGENGSETRRRETQFYVRPSRLPEGLPDWFLQRDLDGDAQLTPAEFSPGALGSELSEFDRLDANSDGIVTAAECVRRKGAEAEKRTAP